MSIQPDPLDLRAHFSRRCSNCRHWIMWAWTATGERMPVDAQPAANGNVIVYRDPARRSRLLATVEGSRHRLEAMRRAGWPTYLHHRMSCPKADEWARTRGRKGAALTPPPVATPTTKSRPQAEQGTLL